jgi:hypothetical protein
MRKVTDQLEKLPPRKVAYVRGRLEFKSKKQAALDAGFSENMAKHAADKIETPDVKDVLALLVQEMIPPEQIARAIADGIGATETKFFHMKALSLMSAKSQIGRSVGNMSSWLRSTVVTTSRLRAIRGKAAASS